MPPSLRVFELKMTIINVILISFKVLLQKEYVGNGAKLM